MTVAWTNPFARFLKDAHLLIRKIQPQPEVRTDVTLLPNFVQKSEDRRFVFDVLDRVEALVTAFDRLRALCVSHISNKDKTDQIVLEQSVSDPGRVHFDVGELARERDQYEQEARPLVAFAYYEMSTVISLLGKPFKPLPSSHLEYLVGVRNKILAHPQRNAFIKNSRSALTIGPILHVHLVGGECWNPLLRNVYLQKLREAGGWLQDDDGVKANIALIRSNIQVEDFSLIERLRLKSYVIPEPDPLQSARDLAGMLQANFLPQIRGACGPVRRQRQSSP